MRPVALLSFTPIFREESHGIAIFVGEPVEAGLGAGGRVSEIEARPVRQMAPGRGCSSVVPLASRLRIAERLAANA